MKHNDVYVPDKPDLHGPRWVLILIFFNSVWPLVNASFVSTKMLGAWTIAAWSTSIFLLVHGLCNKRANRKMHRYRGIAHLIGDAQRVSIERLSRQAGLREQTVLRTLEKMQHYGYLGPDAYIDYNARELILVRGAAHDDEDEIDIALEEIARQMDAPEPPKPEVPTKEEQYEKILTDIRTLNDRIADRDVSEKIDRIGAVTSSIFSYLRIHPENEDEVRKFMSYYLPTTLKLLESYALMEKQSYQGENISASRRKIEDILNTLVTAFEQQQDRLFRTEAMDLGADIDVLSTMLRKDGLVGETQSPFAAATGGAAAAPEGKGVSLKK